MSALDQVKTLLNQGRLDDALFSLKTCVRDSPSDIAARSTLVSLFALQGDLDRAQTQFQAQQNLQGTVLPPAFEKLILASQTRERVINGQETPHYLLEKPSWADDYQTALAAFASTGSESQLNELSASLTPNLDQISGQTGPLSFEGFRNCDTRLSPVIEAVIDGVYTWIPLSDLQRLSIPERPDLVQDLVWCPVILMLTDSEVRHGHLFTTYPGTAEHGSTAAKLARTVEWDESLQSLDIARGLQLFYLGEEATPLFSLGQCSVSGPSNSPDKNREEEHETA